MLEFKGISKNFKGVKALNKVSFSINDAAIHGIVGENGAGKSTLIKVIGGLLQPEEGVVKVNGSEVHFANARQSQQAGISIIAQELNLVPQMTVAENIFLGREPLRRNGLIDWKQVRSEAQTIVANLGLHVSVNQRVEHLSVSDKQLVEIAKALSQDFKVIVMDEPTATLNFGEVERLFSIIGALREQGYGVVYVSHRLREIFQIADRVSVLRDGKKVATAIVRECTEHDIVRWMLGRDVEAAVSSEHVGALTNETPALAVNNLSVPGALNEVSFALHHGEVLGIAGLVGSGRSELMRALFGLEPHRGEILVEGRPVRIKTPTDAIDEGMFMLAEDRKTEGIFPVLSVLENALVARQPGKRSPLFLRPRVEGRTYEELKTFLGIRAHSPKQLVSTLSGGNQQKVLFGRALASKCRVLLLNEPTRGVDVGTKVEIHEIIRGLARDGAAVLVSSSDIPELAVLCDRCLSLCARGQTTTLSGGQISEDNIVACVIGHMTEEALNGKR